MSDLLKALADLAQTTNVWIYLIIFFGELIRVSVSTLRNVLINRGIRLVGSLIAVLEITLWLVITGSVLSSFQSDPWKMLVYAAAFALGNYIGSWLDEKLAFGLSNVQIVVSDMEEAARLTQVIRDNGYGVTTLDVQGINENKRYMMMLILRRKSLGAMLGIISATASGAVVTVSDVKMQKGAYLRGSPARMAAPALKKEELENAMDQNLENSIKTGGNDENPH